MHCCEHDVLDFFKHCQNDWKTKSDNLSILRGWGVKGCLNFFQIVRGSFFSFFHFLDTWSLPSQLDWERSKCAHSQNCPQASNSHKQCGFRLKVFSLFDSNFSLLPFYFSIERDSLLCSTFHYLLFREGLLLLEQFFAHCKILTSHCHMSYYNLLQSSIHSTTMVHYFRRIKCKTFDYGLDLTTCSFWHWNKGEINWWKFREFRKYMGKLV